MDAVIHEQPDVVNILLDAGADANTAMDTVRQPSCTPLSVVGSKW